MKKTFPPGKPQSNTTLMAGQPEKKLNRGGVVQGKKTPLQQSSSIRPKSNTVAPPAYRPSQTPGAVQAKMAGSHQQSLTVQTKASPKPPPVYRPQPAPKCLQLKKTNTEADSVQSKTERVRPSAPPIYRPQSRPTILQAKTSQSRPKANGAKMARQQPAKVLQTKTANAPLLSMNHLGRAPQTSVAPGTARVVQGKGTRLEPKSVRPYNPTGMKVIQRSSSSSSSSSKGEKPPPSKASASARGRGGFGGIGRGGGGVAVVATPVAAGPISSLNSIPIQGELIGKANGYYPKVMNNPATIDAVARDHPYLVLWNSPRAYPSLAKVNEDYRRGVIGGHTGGVSRPCDSQIGTFGLYLLTTAGTRKLMYWVDFDHHPIQMKGDDSGYEPIPGLENGHQHGPSQASFETPVPLSADASLAYSVLLMDMVD